MTRLLYLGNFRHPWCTEVHVSRDAAAIGCEVVRIQEPTSAPSLEQWLVWMRDFETQALRADVVFYQRTWGKLPADETIDLWRRLEDRGVRTASYHLDLYRGLHRESGVAGDPFWQTGTVFTADGDPGTSEWLSSIGVNHQWMPAAIVSDEARVVPGARPPGPVEVVFVGSGPEVYHPEWPWRTQLLNAAQTRFRQRFRKYPRNNVALRGDRLSQLYSGVKVALGDTLALEGHTNYWSDRYYETTGRGGILVAPAVPGIETQFVDGQHLFLHDVEWCWNGEAERVMDMVELVLQMSDGERLDMRNETVRHVQDHHTYKHRVAAMLAILGHPVQ